MNEWKQTIYFEYTGRSTHQSNSLTEVGFTTLGGRSGEIIYHENVPLKKELLCLKIGK